jgi:hypothetical protein
VTVDVVEAVVVEADLFEGRGLVRRRGREVEVAVAVETLEPLREEELEAGALVGREGRRVMPIPEPIVGRAADKSVRSKEAIAFTMVSSVTVCSSSGKARAKRST